MRPRRAGLSSQRVRLARRRVHAVALAGSTERRSSQAADPSSDMQADDDDDREPRVGLPDPLTEEEANGIDGEDDEVGDEDDEDEDIDPEFAAIAEDHLYEDDDPALGGVERDENDDIPDELRDMLHPISEDDGDADDNVDETNLSFDEDDEESQEDVLEDDASAQSAPPPVDDPDIEEENTDPDAPPFLDGDDEVVVDDEDDDDLQSAASILSDRGLLGLGVDGAGRSDMASVKKFALGGPDDADDEHESDLVSKAFGLSRGIDDNEDDDADEEEHDADEGADISRTKQDGAAIDDDYPDLEDEDDEFTLTTQSSLGRVWELNEDTHITITEPGESYVYELDEDDQEDQEMASMRRGKQGGWSGGMNTYPSSDLPEGSREWIARRSYELISQMSPLDMFRWTRRHVDPPESVADLYDEMMPSVTPLGRIELELSMPPTTAPMMGTISESGDDLEEENSEFTENVNNMVQSSAKATMETRSALDRAVNFPCAYKFKVEGLLGDETMLPSVKAAMEGILGKEMSDECFQTEEPDGRYQRVIITVNVSDADQVTSLFEALRNCPTVKFSYG